MSLFKHAMVSGINDALVDNGIVAWPNEKVGFEACASVAADLAGPDMLPTGGLAKESALLIADRLKTAADLLLANGYAPDASTVLRTKQAAQMDFGTRAAVMAEACMSKAASDASLTSVGPNTSESAAATDQHAALDQHNRARNAYLTGVGRTMFPNGGVVGQQMLYPGAPNRASRNSLTALDKQADLSPAARRALIGSGIGLVGGAGAGAALGDEDEMLQNALLGGAAGAGLGAGAGYGYDALMAHRAKKKAPAAAPPATPEQALAQAAVNQAAAAAPAVPNPAQAAPIPVMPEATPSGMGTIPGGMIRTASEDMAADDLTPGATPGALGRSVMFLQGLENMGYQPGAGAQVAAAGLGQAGAPGLEVMAHVLDTAKTAEEIDATLSEVLNYQEKTGSLAEAELVEAVQYVMEKEAEAKKSPGGTMIGYELPHGSNLKSVKERAKDKLEDLSEAAQSAKRTARRHLDPAIKHLQTHKKLYGVGAAGVGAGLAASALHSHLKNKDEEKKSSLLDYLKAAADGSLTDVGENTADSAAEHDQFAELDLHNRSVNEYLHGVGKTRMPNKGQVYAVEPAPHHDGVHASNVPTNETKSAEFAYVNNFRKVANEYGPYLPAVMPREEKVAHLQTMLGLPPSDRIDYLSALLNG